MSRVIPSTLFTELVERHDGDRPAIRIADRVVTYNELSERVRSTAESLRAESVLPGDRVVLLFPNGIELIVAVLALTAIGAIAVPLSALVGRQRLESVIEATHPRFCLTDGTPRLPDGVATVRLRLAGAAALRSPGNGVTALASRNTDPRETLPTRMLGGGSTAMILFTSGSSGQPKGVALSQQALLWTARALANLYQFDADHRELILAPIAHSGGWQRVTATLQAGGCVVLYQGPLSISGILEDIEAHAITGLFLPPPILRLLLKAPAPKVRRAMASCRSIETGTAPTTAEELTRLMALVPQSRVFLFYGLTECSRAVVLEATAVAAPLNSVGLAAPEVEVSIRGAGGERLDPGKPGQIFLRGPQLATGYWNDPRLTATRFMAGWFATGDRGALDENGALTFYGRDDDLITTGGYSFFPAEVERELGPMADTSQYLIAGVKDPRGLVEEVPWAFAVPSNSQCWSPQSFLAAARKRLPPYMVPRGVQVVTALPVTTSGKPDRQRALEIFANNPLHQTM